MRENFANFLGVRFCEFGFDSLSLREFLLNFCKKIQGFFEFKVKNSQKLRLKCFEFFKQFKQGYEFKRKIHAFTRIKNV